MTLVTFIATESALVVICTFKSYFYLTVNNKQSIINNQLYYYYLYYLLSSLFLNVYLYVNV